MRTKFNLIESQTNYKLDYFPHSSPQEEVFVLTGLHLLLPKEKPVLSTSAQLFDASQSKSYQSGAPLQSNKQSETQISLPNGDLTRTNDPNLKQLNAVIGLSMHNGINPGKPSLMSNSSVYKAPVFPMDSPNKNYQQTGGFTASNGKGNRGKKIKKYIILK